MKALLPLGSLALILALMGIGTLPVHPAPQMSVPSFAADPATCNPAIGSMYYNTASSTLKFCSALNTWSSVGGGVPAGSPTGCIPVGGGTGPTTCTTNLTYTGAGGPPGLGVVCTTPGCGFVVSNTGSNGSFQCVALAGNGLFECSGVDSADNEIDWEIQATSGLLTFENLGTSGSSVPVTLNVQTGIITSNGNALFQDCGSTSGGTQNCAKTAHPFMMVRGDVTLNTATSQSITTLPFSSSTSYSCVGSDITHTGGIIGFDTYAAASVTIHENGGANTDELRYICLGF